MVISRPIYYDRFSCIAGSCPDSCCKEWEVQVDEDTAAFYRALPGALGDELRAVLRDTEDGTLMTIQDGRCPMWRTDGLCRIQAQLGHEALCRTCREFPRLTHDYGDFTELGLELSCPEAARLILSDSHGQLVETRTAQEAQAEYDEQAMQALLASRRYALDILCRELPAERKLALLLVYGYQAQNELDGDEIAPPDLAGADALFESLPLQEDAGNIADFFAGLEILTDTWRQRLARPEPRAMGPMDCALARYLVNRYWLQAVSDYDLICRVKLIVISCLLCSLLGGDPEQTAQLFSKEIENDADNLDAILDAVWSEPAFTDANLLGLLLNAPLDS